MKKYARPELDILRSTHPVLPQNPPSQHIYRTTRLVGWKSKRCRAERIGSRLRLVLYRVGLLGCVLVSTNMIHVHNIRVTERLHRRVLYIHRPCSACRSQPRWGTQFLSRSSLLRPLTGLPPPDGGIATIHIG